ncbi:T3SS (YopN, CesT) and YbjN peptide-binding chaperone 1 [Cryptosporangium minutisporangium]|uniref:YbjN domain-containing protein n=1 Tax=Cryptosporangium minutisporangium TaxID=113569 RepID=A0ABP6T6Z4_9ACTN
MPGFDWSTVPTRLAAELARELALEEVAGGPAAALRATFGSVPRVDFVRIAWPVLRDRWLATDADARADVVAGLRAAGLGDHETAPRGAEAQLVYLRSLRNTGRLRKLVLDRFLELGEDPDHHQPNEPIDDEGPVLKSATPLPLPEDPATVDLGAKVEAAWAELRTELAAVLAHLELGAQLTLTLDPTAGGTGDATYTVEFVMFDENLLHAEAVGNAALPPGHRLDRHAIADLVALGWSPPGVVDGTTDNFGIQMPTSDADRLAAIAVRTLREVYGTPHPAFLTYSATALEGEVEVPALGAARRVPGGGGTAGAPAAHDPGAPLPDRVRAVVSQLLSRPVDELPVDADGDIAIRSGSAMVFVRITDDPPLVEVSSPVLTEVRATQRLYERLSALTKTLPVGRLYLEDDTVWASVGVFGTDFQPTHLSTAIRVMTGLADVLDDRLQGDFGGKVFFGEALPERREPGTHGERTGMYL